MEKLFYPNELAITQMVVSRGPSDPDHEASAGWIASERVRFAEKVVQDSMLSMATFNLLWAFHVDVLGESPDGGLVFDRDMATALPPRSYTLVASQQQILAALYRFIRALRNRWEDAEASDIPDDRWHGVHAERVYPGCCRQKTLEWVTRHDVPGVTFVEAHVTHPRERLRIPISITNATTRQCWLEFPDGSIYSGMMQRFYDRDRWREALQPSDEQHMDATPEAARIDLHRIYQADEHWAFGTPSHPFPVLDFLERHSASFWTADSTIARLLDKTTAEIIG